MNITVKVNTVNRTSYISWPSFTKEDVLNNQVDTCSFETRKYGAKSWKPAVGDEILVEDGATKIFAGVIVQVEENIEGRLLSYSVQCKDWSQYLDRSLVVERYENMTVEDIIADINTNYLTGFTVTNVDCSIVVKSIAFNRLPVSKCLQLLAEQVNYSWYVDYDKDIHFFAKNSESAPFALSDTAGNYIFSSLRIKDDLSQLRNRVFVRGGEYKGSTRSENFTGDGTRKTFALANKFSNAPTVTVGGVSKTVGVDFLDQDTSFDCLWNFTEKYLRFVSAPANSAAIVVSGTPLVPIIVQIQDDASIAQYGGVYEFSVTDKTIKSIEEARQYATSQLEAYANKIAEGSFETYESGLRSGQILTIQSDIRDIDSSFLIQRVTLNMRTPTEGLWSVELATLRTIGIIDFLQNLLLDKDQQISVAENEVLEKSYLISETAQVTETITKISPYTDQQTAQVTESVSKDPLGANVSPEWVLGPYVPNGREKLWLKFKETSGATAFDSSTSGKNGTITGATRTTGEEGLLFGSANTDKVTVDNTGGAIFNNTDFSIACRYKMTVSGAVTYLFSHPESGGAGNRIYLSIATNGTVNCVLGSGGVASANTPATKITADGNYHNIIALYRRSDRMVKLIIDGVTWFNWTASTATTPSTTIQSAVFIGNQSSSAVQSASGKIDKIRTFNRILDDSEITLLSNNLNDTLGHTDPKREGLLDISLTTYALNGIGIMKVGSTFKVA